MITSEEPADWRALQREVARILTECGFSVEIEKTVGTARSPVEIDVYAEESIEGRRNSIACECKFWNANVPQGEVLKFRTVCADLGVNAGYIISKKGFQSGAYSAAEFTNVKLLTWLEFQAEFELLWFRKHLEPYVVDRFEEIMELTEMLPPRWFLDVGPEDAAQIRELRESHGPFGMLLMVFTPYVRMFRDDFPLPPLPLSDREGVEKVREGLSKVPRDVMDAQGYRQFLEAAERYTDGVVAEFNAIRDRVEKAT